MLLCRGASERLALVAIPRFADDVSPGPQAPAPRMRTTSTPDLVPGGDAAKVLVDERAESSSWSATSALSGLMLPAPSRWGHKPP